MGELPKPARGKCNKLSSKASRNKGTGSRELPSGYKFGSAGLNRRNERWVAKPSSRKQPAE